MSDNEDSSYESDNDSSSEISENEKIIIKPNINIKKQIIATIDDDDDADNDSLEEDIDLDVDDEEEEIQIGGVKDEEDDEEEDLSEDEEQEDYNEENQVKESSNKKTKKIPIKTNINLPIDTDDDDDDDDEYDDNYLQKFDNDTTNNYIKEFHPECLQHNYDEVAKFTTVIRDSNNIIVDPFHKTIPYLTKYEKARILGQRAKQIECGAKPLVKVPENIVDGYIIAELELQQKRIPFIIRRPIPGGAFEYWNLKDLEIITF
jgi:DNA-directed RNA polymerase I, II, and III subunit RPABC2